MIYDALGLLHTTHAYRGRGRGRSRGRGRGRDRDRSLAHRVVATLLMLVLSWGSRQGGFGRAPFACAFVDGYSAAMRPGGCSLTWGGARCQPR